MNVFKSIISDIVIAVSTTSEGNMSYNLGGEQEVLASRTDFIEKSGISAENCLEMHQVHGNNVIEVGKNMPAIDTEELICDGLITNKSGLALIVKVADCMPVAVYDEINKALAVVHAGRKGVELNILASSLNKMEKLYGTKSGDVKVFVGPAISADSYVFDSTEGVDLEFWGEYFKHEDDGKYHMDIKSKLTSQAIDLGIPRSSLEISDIDTFANKDYFSHRRSMATGESEGRFMLLAYIK